MKYRITESSNFRIKQHLPYLAVLIIIFLGIYFKPVFLNYDGIGNKEQTDLKCWDQVIAENLGAQNWQNRISVGFPLFQQKGIDLFLADLTKQLFPRNSLLLFFLLFGGLGVYALLVFYKYQPVIAFSTALLFTFSFFFFSFYITEKSHLLRAVTFLPWIMFLTIYLQKRKSLLGCGLLALGLVLTFKNMVLELNFSILVLGLIFWFYTCIDHMISRNYKGLIIFTLLFFLANLLAIAAISYPAFYLWELENYAVGNIFGASLITILLIYLNILLLLLWGIFMGKAIEQTTDEDSGLFSHVYTGSTLGTIILAATLVMRFLFDLNFISLNLIIILTTLLFEGVLLILLRKEIIHKAVFSVLLVLSLSLCVFFCLQQEFQETAIARELPAYERSISDEYFSRDPELFRIYPLGGGFMQNRWGKFNQTIGGRYFYSLDRYQNIMRSCLNTELQNRIPINWNILDMLNVKYLIYKSKINSDNLEYASYDLQQKLIIYKNLTYLPRAWFVDEVLLLKQAADILKKLNSGDFDPALTALVESDPGKISAAKHESVSLDSISAEYIQLTTRNDSTSFLVISELYYPGNSSWKAYIDEEEVPILAANYLLRGLTVPAGEHKVIMRYELDELPLLLMTNLIVIIVILVIILLGIYHYIRKNYKGEIVYVIKK